MSDQIAAEQSAEAATAKEGEQETTPTIEGLTEALEALKGESRKWEGRAKENFDARKELDSLKAASMTDAEKVQAAHAALTTDRDTHKERADKAEAALARFMIATEFGLSKEDAEALSSVSDEAALRALAERLAGNKGPQPNPSQGRGGTAPTTAAQAFADSLGELF